MLAGDNCVVRRDWKADGRWTAQDRVVWMPTVRLLEQNHVVTRIRKRAIAERVD